MSKTFNYLNEFINEQPVYSTHQHHLEQKKHQNLDLDIVLSNSYVSWCSLPNGQSIDEREDWLQSIRTNSYFVWLEKALSSIHNIEMITAQNWEAVSLQIKNAHQNPDFHINLLKDKAKYIGFLEDCYWDTGSDVGYPDFITPVYRIDMWIQGYHPENSDSDNCNPHQIYGAMADFDTYVERFRSEIIQRRPNIAALKCAQAYQRTIRFEKVKLNEAKSIFGKHPSELSTYEKNLFGDYMFHIAIELAEQLELPMQIHTGLAKLQGSNPMNLENVIASYPEVQFVLFHGGFPWIYETAGLAHNYSNIVLDINWLPIISTSAATNALNMYMEILHDNQRITWGADTWTSEEAVGAAMAFRSVLTKVLSQKVENRYMRLKHAEDFAQKIMYSNAQKIYSL